MCKLPILHRIHQNIPELGYGITKVTNEIHLDKVEMRFGINQVYMSVVLFAIVVTYPVPLEAGH